MLKRLPLKKRFSIFYQIHAIFEDRGGTRFRIVRDLRDEEWRYKIQVKPPGLAKHVEYTTEFARTKTLTEAYAALGVPMSFVEV